MPKEIERKFTVDELLFKNDYPGRFIKQGYISHDPEKVVRVRRYGDTAYITIKTKTESISRDEYEYEIPVSDAEELLALCKDGVIEKVRFELMFEGKTWEIDQFLGDNEGLWVAEIELESEDEHFEKPLWVKEEVSSDKRYFNSYLSQNPFKSW